MHLDTCFLIDLQREKRTNCDAGARSFLLEHASEFAVISTVVAMEYLEGFADSDLSTARRFLNAFAWVSIDAAVAIRASRVRRQLRKIGGLLPDADILIAACALEHGEPLITNNTEHFKRIDGLQILDYRRA